MKDILKKIKKTNENSGGRVTKSNAQPLASFKHSQNIPIYTLLLTLSFLIAAAAAYFYTGEDSLFDGLYLIISSPSRLVTDYFALGGLFATFFNTFLCGLLANLVISSANDFTLSKLGFFIPTTKKNLATFSPL